MKPVALDAVRSVVRAFVQQPRAPAKVGGTPGVKPVVTISRQTGTDAPAVAARLAELLNERDGGEPPWMEYDRRLVERVAEDHKISHDLVAGLDERDKSWFEHLTAGLSGTATGTDIALRTSQTIRGLARVGRAIIVGRGGQFILAEMKHVVHARLVAPLEWRAAHYGQRMGLERDDAEDAVREIDQERARFIRNHFRGDVADIDHYDVSINMSRVGVEAASAAIAAVVPRP